MLRALTFDFAGVVISRYLLTKCCLDQLNGFNETYQVCEDGELIDRIYKNNGFSVLPQKITTSARRFEENGL